MASTWPYAARMFHFAEPEEAGFGVMIFTPGFTRSSQVLMPLGLPLRTTITTTDWVRMPLLALSFQSEATSFSSTSFCTSGSSERCTMSAFWPPSTARLWSPEAPYDCLKVTPEPAEVLLKSAMTCLLACSRIEKPTRLTVPPPPLEAPVLPPQPDSASAPTREAAAAAFHFMVMSLLVSVSQPLAGVSGLLSHVD